MRGRERGEGEGEGGREKGRKAEREKGRKGDRFDGCANYRGLPSDTRPSDRPVCVAATSPALAMFILGQPQDHGSQHAPLETAPIPKQERGCQGSLQTMSSDKADGRLCV